MIYVVPMIMCCPSAVVRQNGHRKGHPLLDYIPDKLLTKLMDICSTAALRTGQQ